jgi:hypothetical protein
MMMMIGNSSEREDNKSRSKKMIKVTYINSILSVIYVNKQVSETD